MRKRVWIFLWGWESFGLCVSLVEVSVMPYRTKRNIHEGTGSRVGALKRRTRKHRRKDQNLRTHTMGGMQEEPETETGVFKHKVFLVRVTNILNVIEAFEQHIKQETRTPPGRNENRKRYHALLKIKRKQMKDFNEEFQTVIQWSKEDNNTITFLVAIQDVKGTQTIHTFVPVNYDEIEDEQKKPDDGIEDEQKKPDDQNKQVTLKEVFTKYNKDKDVARFQYDAEDSAEIGSKKYFCVQSDGLHEFVSHTEGSTEYPLEFIKFIIRKGYATVFILCEDPPPSSEKNTDPSETDTHSSENTFSRQLSTKFSSFSSGIESLKKTVNSSENNGGKGGCNIL